MRNFLGFNLIVDYENPKRENLEVVAEDLDVSKIKASYLQDAANKNNSESSSTKTKDWSYTAKIYVI